MRRYSLPLLLVLWALLSSLQISSVHAEEPAAASVPPTDSAPLSTETLPASAADAVLPPETVENLAEQESAQLVHLRKENQKLKLQLREAQAQQPQNPLTETQIWYLLGATTALLGAAFGALLRGYRRRRQWLN